MKQGELPSLVFVAYLVPNGTGEAIVCTGTLISPQFVLTAAHCVEPPSVRVFVENFRVVVGTVNWKTPDRKERRVVRAIAYPGYSSFSGQGDVGLLKLAAQVGVPPMPLARRRFWSSGSEAEIAGWGKLFPRQHKSTYVLHRARTTILGLRECREQGGDPGQICTEDTTAHRTSACYGDSGGPLLMRRPWDRRLVEIGVTHGGFNCNPRRTSFFTSTVPIFNWVRTRIAEAEGRPSSATRAAATRQSARKPGLRAPPGPQPMAAR